MCYKEKFNPKKTYTRYGKCGSDVSVILNVTFVAEAFGFAEGLCSMEVFSVVFSLHMISYKPRKATLDEKGGEEEENHYFFFYSLHSVLMSPFNVL